MTEEYLFPGGHVSSVTARDESGNISGKINYHYGVEGEVLNATIGDITPSSYTYDANYRVTSIIDGNGHTTSYHYDNAAGYLGSILGPDGHSEQFSEYDGCGNLLKYIDPRNVETDYHYDTHGMPTDVSYPSTPSLNTHTNYDAIGRVQSFTDSVGSVSYHYDVNDIVTDVTRGYTGGPTKTLSYSYYPDGSRQSMSTPGGIFQYAYDDQGRPTTLTGPSSISAAWDYTTHSSLHKQTLGNGVETTYTYNTAETILQQIQTKKDSTVCSEFANFGFDASDNLLSVNSYLLEFPNLSGTTSFEYDAQDQLTKETTTRGVRNVLNFEYDHAGNPTSFAGTSNSFNAANRNTALAYDNAGNPATHDGTLLTFDAENHMTAHGTNFSAGYTASGLRAWKQSGTAKTFYLYDGSTPVCELDAQGNVMATNVFGPTGLLGRQTTTDAIYYTFDAQGNAAQRFDLAGTVLSSHAFSAYGTEIGTNTTADPYAGFGAQYGYYKDNETGLSLLGHRYYDANQGRFLNQDPIGSAGGLNLYSYADNNPVNGADPSGFTPAAVDTEPGDDVISDATINNAHGGSLAPGFSAITPQLAPGSQERQDFSQFVHNNAAVATVLGSVEAVTGCDYIAGKPVSPLQRCLGGMAAIAPMLRGLAPLKRLCRNGGGCFVAGTLVQMADGTTKPIEQVQVGEFVQSRNPETGQTEVKRVEKTSVRHVYNVLTLHLADAQTGEVQETITATSNHPFYVQDKGFVAAGDLAIGNSIVTRAGPALAVKSKTISSDGNGIPVYNFVITDDHTYFVGTANGGAWVHNDLLDCTKVVAGGAGEDLAQMVLNHRGLTGNLYENNYAVFEYSTKLNGVDYLQHIIFQSSVKGHAERIGLSYFRDLGMMNSITRVYSERHPCEDPGRMAMCWKNLTKRLPENAKVYFSEPYGDLGLD